MDQQKRAFVSKETFISIGFGLSLSISLIVLLHVFGVMRIGGEETYIPSIDEIVSGKVETPSVTVPEYRGCVEPDKGMYELPINSDIWLQNPDNSPATDGDREAEVVVRITSGAEDFTLSTTLEPGELWWIDVNHYIKNSGVLSNMEILSNKLLEVRVCEKEPVFSASISASSTRGAPFHSCVPLIFSLP